MKNVILRAFGWNRASLRPARPAARTVVFSLACLAGLAAGAHAQTLDTVVFGNTSSESGHALATSFSPATDITAIYWQNNTPAPSDPSTTPPSDVVAGGQGLSARRLLPRNPNADVYGGQMTFTMAVDPVKQNYFTVKMWGQDPGAGFLILDCNGKEIGNRHGGGGLNEDPLYFQGTGWYANRFFYRTEPLPLMMTHGRNAVSITIRSLGSIYYYAPNFTYVPQYQHLMTAPSLGVYTAYTHAGSIPDVTGEPQGTAPAVPTPRTSENETTALANVKTNVNNSLAAKLNAAGAGLSQGDASFLAQCYDARTNAGASWIVYPSGKIDPDVGNQIVAALDALVTSYGTDATVATNGWGGALGDMGDAIQLGWPLISNSMSATVAYGGTVGTVTRQAGWSAALRASVDAGRYNRRTIANQDLSCSWTIYRANRGLLLVDSANALYESEAARYFKEAAGILPWTGNDQPGGGPTPVKGTMPYGPNWYMCTSKGTTKDGEGFVGSDYGEQGAFIYHMGLYSGDAQIQARGLLMTRARCQFRYPGVDDKGYLIMMGTDPIGVRNNDLPSHYVYLGRGFGDDFLMASQGASVIGNDLLGYFQQGMNDGQMVRNFSNDPYLPGRWAAIKALPQTNVKLPTTSGQPDYAWVDEENMAVVAKHGEERFYANLFWRQPGFINGLAKVFHLTPGMAHLADVMVDDVRFRPTGKTVLTGGVVDTFTAPPDKPVEAFSGLNAPVAWRSDLTSIPATNRDAGRGTGYTLRYGNWLVGINADYSTNYTVQMPSDFTSGTDLISGNTMSGQVTLAPKTSVVFYLPTNVDPNPPPSRSLLVSAAGGNGSVTLGWYAAGAATSYNVLRATTNSGPYAAVASGVTTSGYTDAAVTNGTTYYYVLQSVNAAGVASGYSPEATATPAAPQTATLAAPWSDADLGTSPGGSAQISGGTFTVKSGIGDLNGSADNCHFAFQALAGDCVVTTRLTGQSNASSGAKSGLMVRSSLAAGSAKVHLIVALAKRAEFTYRSDTNNGTVVQTGLSGLTPPAWLRLVRTNNTITGYASADGAAWTQIGTCTLSGLPYVAYVGLTTCPGSSGSGQTNTATFDNVSFPRGATAAPAAPTGLTAVGGAASVSLTWNPSAGAASYNVRRATNSSGPFAIVATGVAPNSFTDSGLGDGTYYYAVSAVNAVGESANSATVSVQVGGTLPGALTGLAANVSSGQVILSWNASAGAAGYRITRQSDGTNAVALSASVNATTYTDTGLSDGTQYAYGVVPVNAAGQGQGDQLTVLPPGGLPAGWQSQDVGDPLVGGASCSGGTYTLMGSGHDIWSTSDQFRCVYQAISGDCIVTARVVSVVNSVGTTTDKVGVMIRNTLDANSAYYAVYANTSSGSAQYRAAAGAGAAGQGSFSGTNLPYWVRVVRAGSTLMGYCSSDGVTWTSLGSATIPMNATICAGLVACGNNDTGFVTATFDNVSFVQNLASGGTATANVGSSGAQATQAFDGNNGTKWYTGVNGVAGWLQYQFGGGTTKTVAQYQLTSAADTPQRDPASWQFLGSNNGSAWTLLDTQSGQTFANRAQSNAYTVVNPAAYAYHRLNVTANAGGSGYGIQLAELSFLAPVQIFSALPPLAPDSLAAAWSSGQVALSWPSSLGATGYSVKRATAPGGPYTALATGVNATAYTDSAVTNGTTYYYVVTAVGPGGESGNSPEDSATPTGVPAVPTGLTATAVNARVSLSWSAAAAATSYHVRRGTTSGGPYTTVATTTGNAYTDGSATNNTTYYYVVSAVNIGGESANSAEVNATPTARLTGTIIGTAGSYNNKGNTKEMALDGSLATFFDAPVANGAWVGLDLGAPAVITQVRYAPRASYASRMIGGKFQGSNTADFSGGVVDLFTVPSPAPAYGVITTQAVTNTTAFQYVRYLSPNNSNCNVAEIEFDGALSPPPAPANVSATGSHGKVAMSWSPAVTATSYNVKRASATNGPFTTIMTGVTGTSAVNTGLTDGTPVYYVINAVSAAGAGADSAPAGAMPQMTYADYAQQYGLGGATSTNGNGVANLAAYAFGLPPTGTASAGLPTVGNDGTYLTITFPRRKAPTDVTYAVEASGDLLTWNAGAAYVTELPAQSLDGTFERVTVRDNTPMSAAGPRFLRVRLTLP